MQTTMNVLALVKKSERFIFLYDDNSSAELLQTLGKYATDPELNFTWYDAAVLSQKVRRLREQAAKERAESDEPTVPFPTPRFRDAA